MQAFCYPKQAPINVSYVLNFQSGSCTRFSSFFQDPGIGPTPLCASFKLQLESKTYEVVDGSYSFKSYPKTMDHDTYEWPNIFECGRGYLGLTVINMVKAINNAEVDQCLNMNF